MRTAKVRVWLVRYGGHRATSFHIPGESVTLARKLLGLSLHRKENDRISTLSVLFSLFSRSNSRG